MPRPPKGKRFGKSASHHRHIMANLATDLFVHERVTTTEAKAKELRPLAEKLITKARKGDLHARRIVLRTIHDKAVVARLFEEVAPRYEGRQGGYTRITKLGPRRGDGADEAIIELV
jgi:large subunit ribosomal protein L17